jgi:hypothetical protein
LNTADRTKITSFVKVKYNTDLQPSTLILCERAASTILKDFEFRKKNVFEKNNKGSLKHFLEFHASHVEKAAKAIANNSGSTKANMLGIIFIVILVALVIIYLQHSDLQHPAYNESDIMKMIKDFKQ